MFKGSINGRKAGPFEFNKKERIAVELLKASFIRALILIHFKPDRQIRIETDILDFCNYRDIVTIKERANYKQPLSILISNDILFPQNNFSRI
jgi:hypothetical protein